jgi:hypothetical protein
MQLEVHQYGAPNKMVFSIFFKERFIEEENYLAEFLNANNDIGLGEEYFRAFEKRRRLKTSPSSPETGDDRGRLWFC